MHIDGYGTMETHVMDDRMAIEQVLSGDREAFRFLVERYQNQALTHAAALLGGRTDAQDAVQEAFLDAFGALRRFDLTRRFYPWLYVLVRNRCFKLLAARKPTEDIEEIAIVAPKSGITAEDALTLERALKTIDPQDREIVTLKHLDGLSYREIAEYLGIPQGTVMSRLFYARRSLRGALEKDFMKGGAGL